jgi:MoaA/NifB/PqqE/SkfB family radical SAM enzyme
MSPAAAEPFRVRGKNWDYFSSLQNLLESSPLRDFRLGMVRKGNVVCGKRNCAASDMSSCFLSEEEVSGSVPRSEGRYELDMLAVSVTNYCRGACRNCFQNCSTKNNTAVPRYVLDALAREATAKRVFLMGGEIFHLPNTEVERALDWAVSLGGDLGVTTAGDGILGDYLDRYPWGEMRISVDAATREVHRIVRPGIDYDLLWENLSRASDLLKEQLVALITVSSYNSYELPELIEKLSSLVKRIRLNVVFKGGRAREEVLLENNPHLLAMLAHQLPETIEAAAKQGVSVEWPLLRTILSQT